MNSSNDVEPRIVPSGLDRVGRILACAVKRLAERESATTVTGRV